MMTPPRPEPEPKNFCGVGHESAWELHFFTARRRRMVGFVLVATAAVICCSQTYAAVINAKSVALADVATAVAAARDGDTVSVPAGSATWATPLTITKLIQLVGAGGDVPSSSGNTIIAGNAGITIKLPREAPSSFVYSFRLSGFEFRGQGNLDFSGISAASQNPLVLGCVSRFRMDHCYFNYPDWRTRFDNLLGVVDHCTFIRAQQPFIVSHTNWTPPGQATPSAYALGSWADDPYWGTEKFLYFEDCKIVFTNPALGVQYGPDADAGARFVIRNSTLINSGVTGHGTEGQANRGTKQLDLYDNLIKYTTDITGATIQGTAKSMSQIRSGTWLFHDNKCFNVTSGPPFQLYRTSRPEKDWGPANGMNRYDDNAGSTPVYSGTASVSSSTALIDTKRSTPFPIGGLSGDGSGIYMISNIDQLVKIAPDGSKRYQVSDIQSNTGTQANYSGSALTFVAGDRYEIWKLKASLDQGGQGKGKLLVGNPYLGGATYFAGTNILATYPQAGFPLEPCYSWNNSNNGTANAVNFGRGPKMILQGRDYFNNTPKPGYQKYTYPHPLTGGANSLQPAPPSNLRVMPGT